MLELISPPATTADALLIVRTLGDRSVAPYLVDEYGVVPVEDTRENALAWMTALMRDRFPGAYPAGAQAHDLPVDLEATLTVAQTEVLQTVGVVFDFLEPKDIDPKQSAIILAAMRRRAHRALRPDARRESLSFLCRQAPGPDERALSRMALTASIQSA